MPWLVGCGIGAAAGPNQDSVFSVAGAAVGGHVHGGQQPVTGAAVYMFSAGLATGNSSNTTYTTEPNYAAKPYSMLTSTSGTTKSPVSKDADSNYYVTTDANGDFSLTAGTYNASASASGCGTGDTNGNQYQVYFLVIGGNSGAGINSEISMLAAVGDCSSLSSSTVVDINEITTVVGATALQQFANFSTGNTVTPVGFSSSLSNDLGLRRAFLTANNIVNIATGTPYTTTPSNTAGYVPVGLIYDLANVLAGCVNSVPSTNSTYCSTLSTETGSASITDTLTDALEIALNPTLGSTSNVTTMWNNIASSAAFPTESAAPNDWSIGINYNSMLSTSTTAGTYPDTYGVEAMAIDASGNIWFPPYNPKATASPELFELDNVGNVVTGPTVASEQNNTSYVERFAAVDPNGYIWQDGTKTEVWTPAGTREINSASFTGNFGLAFDAAGNGWLAETTAGTIGEAVYNHATNATSFTYSTPVYTSTAAATGISGSGRYVAIDSNGYGWLPNYSTTTSGYVNTVAVFSTSPGATSGAATITGVSGTPFAVETALTSTDINPLNVALDANNYAFIGLNGVYAEFTPAPNPVLQSGVSGFGGATPNSVGQTEVQVDGMGNVWLANYGTGYNTATGLTGSFLQKFAGAKATTPGTVLSGSGIKSDQKAIDKPWTMEIDSSGNIWLGNTGTGLWPGASIAEFVGLAAPVITPKALALKDGKVATCP